MLPDVGSTIVPPGLRSPARSAASIIGSPIRSLTEPPGFSVSSLARIRGCASSAPEVAAGMRVSRTSGVSPTRSRIDSAYCIWAEDIGPGHREGRQCGRGRDRARRCDRRGAHPRLVLRAREPVVHAADACSGVSASRPRPTRGSSGRLPTTRASTTCSSRPASRSGSPSSRVGEAAAGEAILLFACGSMIAAGVVLFLHNPRFLRAAAIQAVPPLVAVVAILALALTRSGCARGRPRLSARAGRGRGAARSAAAGAVAGGPAGRPSRDGAPRRPARCAPRAPRWHAGRGPARRVSPAPGARRPSPRRAARGRSSGGRTREAIRRPR